MLFIEKWEEDSKISYLGPLRVLDQLVKKCVSSNFWPLCYYVLNDPDWRNGTGSTKKHHVGPGQLVQHTMEVALNAVSMGQAVGANISDLVVAALWHDYHKKWDYEIDPESKEPVAKYRHTDRAGKIYHIAGSYGEFVHAALAQYWAWSTVDRIGHILLSHHGRKEWGSPIEPKTLEAVLFHTADSLSAYGMLGNEYYELLRDRLTGRTGDFESLNPGSNPGHATNV